MAASRSVGGPEEPTTAAVFDDLEMLCTTIVITAAQGMPTIMTRGCGDGLRSCMNQLQTQMVKATEALRASPRDGDVLTMTLRALNLFMEQAHSFFLFGRDARSPHKSLLDISKAFLFAFQLVSRKNALEELVFVRTSLGDLVEEVLKAFGIARREEGLTPPSVHVQLTFCQSAILHAAHDTDVLRCLAGLVRSRALTREDNVREAVDIVLVSLKKTVLLPIDKPWETILRAVTECLVTLHYWAANAEKAPPRVRPRGATADTAASVRFRFPSATSKDVAVSFADICVRATQENASQDVLGLVLACASTVFGLLQQQDENSVADLLPAEKRRSMIYAMTTLQRNKSHTVDTFSSPYVKAEDRITPRGTRVPEQPHSTQSGGANEEAEVADIAEEILRVLPNLNWILPSVEWSSVYLLSTLLGMRTVTVHDYVWAEAVEEETYYWFSKRERDKLSNAFFNSVRTVKLKYGNIVNVAEMTATQRGIPQSRHVHFQPVPYSSSLAEPPFATLSELTFDLASEPAAFVRGLLDSLQRLSYGTSATTLLSTKLLLSCVLQVGSAHPQAATSIIRRFAASCADQDSLERLSQHVLAVSGGGGGSAASAEWATILADARVPEAIHSAAVRQTGSSVRVSPVARIIRSESSKHAPPMRRLQLGQGSCSLRSLLLSSTEAEVTAYLSEKGMTPLLELWSAEDLEELAKECDKDRGDSGSSSIVTSKMRSVLTNFVVRLADTLPSLGHADVLAEAVQSAAPWTFVTCADSQANGRGELLCCPLGHPLVVSAVTMWVCNKCKKSSPFHPLRCHACDYDLCKTCVDSLLLRVNCTARVADVAEAIRHRDGTDVDTLEAPFEEDDSNNESLSTCVLPEQLVLFVRDSQSPLPPTAPAFVVANDAVVHYAPFFGSCACGHRCPTTFALSDPRLDFNQTTLLFHLIRLFGCEDLCEQPLKEAVSGLAVRVFLHGPTGLNPALLTVLQALSPSLSVVFKRNLVEFLGVSCRRFSLWHLQDENVQLRGNVAGDVHSNGLPTKVEVRRNASNIPTLLRTFISCPSTRTRIEFFFAGEEGFGSGPTQELYNEMSSYFVQKKELWFVNDEGASVGFPSLTRLFLREFYVLGALCSRAFADRFVFFAPLDVLCWDTLLHLSRTSEAHHGGSRLPPSAVVRQLEPTLARSLDRLLEYSADELSALELENEQGEAVTPENVDKYVAHRIASHFDVALVNLEAFLQGVAAFVDPLCFFALSSGEINHLLCGVDGSAATSAPLFTEEELASCVEEAHGYTPGCAHTKMFISIVGGEFTRAEQTLFVEFLTGSSRLPLGGLKGLNQKIVVAKKDFEHPGDDGLLPSCNTCFLYFKLPPYKTREVMKARLLTAIHEGLKCFGLS